MGYVYIVLAAVCWGLLGPVARLAFQEGVTPMEVAFWRAALGGGCFLLHAGIRPSTWPARRDLPAVAFFGLVGVALFYAAYQLAVARGGATLASVLLYTAPAWVALMSIAWLGERLTGRKALAIGLTLLGVALVASGGGTARITAAALIWGLTAGLCYAFYYPFGRRYFARYTPAAIYALALPVGALVLWPLVDFAEKTPRAWLALGAVILVSTYLAYLFYGQALQHLEATRASIIATLEPVVAGLAAYLWWGEQFGAGGYLGAALVLAGVLLAMRARDPTLAS